jgi:hypothetical protein
VRSISLNDPLPGPPPFHRRESNSPLPLAGEDGVGVVQPDDWIRFVAGRILQTVTRRSAGVPPGRVDVTPGTLAEPLVSWLIAPSSGASA